MVTTDPELDDLNSLLRMLLYSNEIDIVGLVYSASQHHYEGDPEAGIEPHRWPEPGARLHIDEAVDAYEEVYENLVVHDSDFPSPDHLRSLVKVGNVKNVGDMSQDTEGSDHIKEILLDDEPGQVFLQAWGGPNTIARALKSIEDDYKNTPQWDAIYAKVVGKAVLTSFGQQDTTFTDYIKPTWPDLENREVATSIWGYGSRGSALPEHAFYHGAEWTGANVSDVGPMGDAYRVWGDGKQMAAGFDDEDYFGLSGYTREELVEMGYRVWTAPQEKGSWISEGDSSNFALLVDNGLRNWEHPSWGGWGGRQQVSPTDPVSWSNRGVQDIGPDGNPRNDYAAARWFDEFQNDFAARLQWSVTDSFEDANHEPVIGIDQGIDLVARPGQSVELDAVVSDPDGDDVTVEWWNYAEAGTYPEAVALSAANGTTTSLTVPADAEPGQTIHVIAEAHDNGTPALTRYQRVVVTVAEAADEDGIPILAEVPELGGPEGALTLTVANYGDGVVLTGPTNVGDRLRFDGALPHVTITDTRNATQAGDSGWTVSGRASDFTTGTHRLDAAHLGWTPWAQQLRDGVDLGATIDGILRDGPGLATPATLASAPTETRLGTATITADLRLEAPVDTPEGTYESRLKVSLFPVD